MRDYKFVYQTKLDNYHFIFINKCDINLNVSSEIYAKIKMKLLFKKVKDKNYYYCYYLKCLYYCYYLKLNRELIVYGN